jgi:hypothetical protein
MGARILCKYNWTGRRKDQEVRPVAGETRKASRSGARKVIRLRDASKSAPSRRIIPKPPPEAAVVYFLNTHWDHLDDRFQKNTPITSDVVVRHFSNQGNRFG